MRFYDREQEIAFLREAREAAKKVARFTVVTGRRRIGKTTLIREAYKDEPFVYFFVARKAESDLCEVYLEEISEKLKKSPGVFMVSFDDTESHYNNGSAKFDITFDEDENEDICLTYLDTVKDLIAPYD